MPRRLLLALTLLSLLPSVLCHGAQLAPPFSKQPLELSGALSGTVHTNRNEPVKDVRIELVPVAGIKGTAVSTYSAGDGSFAFSNLAYGTYMLTATMGVTGTSQDVIVKSGQDWVSVAMDV